MNREEWLTSFGKLAEEFFRGFRLAPYKLSCSWPCRNALSRRQRRIGECHAIESSKGGVHEIFISPLIDEPLEVAGVVCHEIAHVAAGIKEGHAGKFVKVCKHIGLTKNKPTQAMPGALLNEKLGKVIAGLGAYPHSAIVPGQKDRKASSTVRLTCSCGCKIGISQKWLESAGLPTCGCGLPFLINPEEDGE